MRRIAAVMWMALAGASAQAFAQALEITAKVDRIYVMDDFTVLVYPANPMTVIGRPYGCAHSGKRMVLDVSTEWGRAQHAVLLTAMGSDRPVTLGGFTVPTCVIEPTSEKVRYIGLLPPQ